MRFPISIIPRNKIFLFVTIFVSILLLTVIFYLLLLKRQLTIESSEDEIVESENVEITREHNIDGYVVKRVQIDESTLPVYVQKMTTDTPLGFTGSYNGFEYLGFKVISTGKMESMDIYSKISSKKLGRADTLEVTLDGSDEPTTYLLVLRIYNPEEDRKIIGPDFIAMAVDNMRVRNKDDTNSEEYIKNEIFKKDAKILVVPHVYDEVAQYIEENSMAYTGYENMANYYKLVEMYYGGKSTAIVETILKNVSLVDSDVVFLKELIIPR